MTDKNQLLPTTQIIELRERNTRSVSNSAGDYRVNLDRPVTLNEGDTVSIHSAYIDTSSSATGLITIEADKAGTLPDGLPYIDDGRGTISATVGYYVTNIPSSGEGHFSPDVKVQSKVFSPTGTTLAKTDGKLYVACHKSNTFDPTSIEVVSGIIYKSDPAYIKSNPNILINALVQSIPQGSDTPIQHPSLVIDFTGGSGAFIRSLMDVESELRIDNDFVTKVNNDAKKNGYKSAIKSVPTFPIHCLEDSFGYIDTLIPGSKNAPKYNTVTKLFDDEFGSIIKTGGAGASQFNYTLVQNKVSLRLPAGKYTASELSHRIGIEFTKTNNGGAISNDAGVIVNNGLLKTIRQMMIEADGKSTSQQIHFIESTEGTQSFQFTTALASGPNYVIGSDQFGITYNDTDNKVEIDKLHMPLLDVSNAQQGLQGGLPEIRAYEAGAPLRRFFVNKHSGVFLVDVFPHSVWIDGLKLDPSVIAGSGTITNVSLDGNDSDVPLFTGDKALQDGVNITGEDVGLDSTINKIATTTGTSGVDLQINKAFDIPLEIPTFDNYLATTTEETIPIFGEKIINSAQFGSADEGYYQLEVSMGVPFSVEGKDQFNNKIAGLCSKYYQAGSYTSTQGEASFGEYVHKGAPVDISSCNVRIHNPDNSLAQDIDDNNAVFIKIQKLK